MCACSHQGDMCLNKSGLMLSDVRLRQLSEYGIGLSPNETNPENAVRDLVAFLPVLAFDGANMTQIDAGGILDIAMAGTSATLLARKWESALLVNVDNGTLR